MGKSRTEASRAERKAKKRAAEDAIPDLPDSWTEEAEIEPSKTEKKDSKKRKREGDDEELAAVKEEKESKKEKKKRRKEAGANGEVANGEVEDELEKLDKKPKKEKKDKKAKADEVSEAPVPVDADMADAPMDEAPKKSKKERKAERKAKEAAEAAANGTAKPIGINATTSETTEQNPAVQEGTVEENKARKNNRNREKRRKGESAATSANGEAAEKEKSGKPARFICFVGNLPFTANTASVEKHFASVKPKSVRAPTEKDQSTKSKGFAFVEFEGYDHMKTALKLLHHSMFDDGISAPRQINVELTAGGGGNTKGRREKIVVKNTKLNEERSRRILEEKKAKLTKQAQGGKQELDESGIHPSRRGRVPIA